MAAGSDLDSYCRLRGVTLGFDIRKVRTVSTPCHGAKNGLGNALLAGHSHGRW
jgi:hypothetical protein